MRAKWMALCVVCIACGSDGDGGGGGGNGNGNGGNGTGGSATGGSAGNDSGVGGSPTGGSSGSGGATGGTAGTPTGGAAGTPSGGAAGSGGTGGGGNPEKTLCDDYCAIAGAETCEQPPGCFANCMARLTGSCASLYHTAYDCMAQNQQLLCQSPVACGSEMIAAIQCNGGQPGACAPYCAKAITAPNCTSNQCWTDCGATMAGQCGQAAMSYFLCAANVGTANCTDVTIGANDCTFQKDVLDQCNGTGGSGGTGGIGGTGGSTGGNGGTGGSTGGNGGTGGGICSAPSELNSVSCNGSGNLVVAGNTPVIAFTIGAAIAPATCTFANSITQAVQGNGTVIMGVPSSVGCVQHRVCNYDNSCTTDYSPGKVISRCFTGSAITCSAIP